MTLARRIGWGLGAFLLILGAMLATMVRFGIDRSAIVPAPAAAPAKSSLPLVPASAQRSDGAFPSLIIPVQGVAAAQLSDTWGDSRGGGTRAHHAIDIMAPKGTPVLAAADGTVEKIFESAAGGHTIYVRTADGGTIHYYAHLDRYEVAERQAVRQGEVIAAVGNTGSAAGGPAHLHFEIKRMRPGERWWQGENINPYPVLMQAAR